MLPYRPDITVNKYPPKKAKIKWWILGSVLTYAYTQQRIEETRYFWMQFYRKSTLEALNNVEEMDEQISSTIKNLDGDPVELKNEAYRFTYLYYGDFGTFFNLYSNLVEVYPNEKIQYIYLTDAERIRDLMKNTMKVQLKDTTYCYEGDRNLIKNCGLKPDFLYMMNKDSKVLMAEEIRPEDSFQMAKLIKSSKNRMREEKDREFVNQFNFRQQSKEATSQ